MAISHVIKVDTVAELKLQPGNSKNVVLLSGKTTIGDNNARTYYWDDTSVETEDMTYMNVISVTGVNTGRWKALNVKMQLLPQGVLVLNGSKKELFISGTTSANSDCTVYLTYDNTATGTPIFTDVWFDDSKAVVDTVTVNDAVSSCRKSLSTNLKVLTHLFFRGSNNTISLLGTNVLGFRSAVTGTAVKFKIEGV